MQSISNFVKPDPLPQYFATDIDQTFYIEDEKTFETNIQAFNKITKIGANPFFCTGRSRASVMNTLGAKFVEKTGYNGIPGVYYNGAVVYDKDGNILQLTKFPAEVLKSIINHLVQSNNRSGAIFHTLDCAYSLDIVSSTFEKVLLSFEEPYPSIVTAERLSHFDIIHLLIDEMGITFPDIVDGKDYVGKPTFEGYTVITPTNVTKAKGINAIMNNVGVPKESCIFIGDGNNDIEAMEQSDISFAVKNADDRVKSHAKYVLDVSVNECGFARAVELIYGN